MLGINESSPRGYEEDVISTDEWHILEAQNLALRLEQPPAKPIESDAHGSEEYENSL